MSSIPQIIIDTISEIQSPPRAPRVNIPATEARLQIMRDTLDRLEFQKLYMREEYQSQMETIWDEEPEFSEFHKYKRLDELRQQVYNQTAAITRMMDESIRNLTRSEGFEIISLLYKNAEGQYRFPTSTPSNLSSPALPPQPPITPEPILIPPPFLVRPPTPAPPTRPSSPSPSLSSTTTTEQIKEPSQETKEALNLLTNRKATRSKGKGVQKKI